MLTDKTTPTMTPKSLSDLSEMAQAIESMSDVKKLKFNDQIRTAMRAVYTSPSLPLRETIELTAYSDGILFRRLGDKKLEDYPGPLALNPQAFLEVKRHHDEHIVLYLILSDGSRFPIVSTFAGIGFDEGALIDALRLATSIDLNKFREMVSLAKLGLEQAIRDEGAYKFRHRLLESFKDPENQIIEIAAADGTHILNLIQLTGDNEWWLNAEIDGVTLPVAYIISDDTDLLEYFVTQIHSRYGIGYENLLLSVLSEVGGVSND